MSYSFNFIEHTADIAFEAEADSLEELFIAAAYGWKETLLESNVAAENESGEIKLQESSVEELLVHFLDDLNFLLNTKHWVFSSVKELKLDQENKEWKLSAIISGEEFNPDKHEIKAEIKAVTFHQMEVKKENKKYWTRVVFDI